MYLDKGLRDHSLLQAIARVNRPYNDLKKFGVVLDYFGVFEKLQDALNFDRNELGEVAFPLTRLREQFRLEMQWQLDLFAEFPKTGDRDNLMAILKDHPPDAKALSIEAMLAAELQLRAGEDEEFQPLSERLKRIVQQKRSGTLAGLALLKELEELTKEAVALIQESKRPLMESIPRAAQERSPGLSSEEAARISAALVGKADEILFPGWTEQEHLDTELFREFTKLLIRQFPSAGLHGRNGDFVDRSIKLFRKSSYRAQSDA